MRSGATLRSFARLKSLLHDDRDPTIALRDLWALHISGGLDDGTASELLDHPLAAVRRWTIRLLGDDHRMNSDLRSKLVRLAESEPEPPVRSQLASSCQRWGAADALPILSRLVQRDSDATDTHIPNLIWWAFERQLRNDPQAVVALLCTPVVQRGRLIQSVLERTARALASDGSADDVALCTRLLDSASRERQSEPIVTGMDMGLEGRRLAPAPPALKDSLARLWAASGGAPELPLIRLCARMKRPEAIEAALKLARDRHEPESRRISMIALLG